MLAVATLSSCVFTPIEPPSRQEVLGLGGKDEPSGRGEISSMEMDNALKFVELVIGSRRFSQQSEGIREWISQAYTRTIIFELSYELTYPDNPREHFKETYFFDIQDLGEETKIVLVRAKGLSIKPGRDEFVTYHKNIDLLASKGIKGRINGKRLTKSGQHFAFLKK